MKSKIRIDNLQAKVKNTEGIRDLSSREITSVIGGGGELLTRSRFRFEAPQRVQQRPILEITGLSVEHVPANRK